MKRAYLLFLAGIVASAPAADDAGAAGLNRAIGFFEERLKRDPGDYIAANQFADRLLRRLARNGRIEDLRRADEITTLSLKAGPPKQNPGGLAARARVLSALHRFREAADLARQLETTDPGKPLSQQVLGDALLALGDPDGAERAYVEARKRGGQDAGTEYRAAGLAWQRGDIEAGARHLDAVVEFAKTDSPEVRSWALVQRGELAFRRGRHESAEKDYVAALALAPDYWTAIEHLAELRGAQGRDAEAGQLFERAANVTGRPEMWQALGDLHAFYKRPAEAKAAHDKALAGYRASIDRGEVLYIHHLAGFFSDSREDSAQAVGFAQRDLKLRQTGAAWDALAWAQYRSGDFKAALESSAKALATGTADTHVIYHAAMIRMSAGAVRDGQALLRRCGEVNPHFSGFHIHR